MTPELLQVQLSVRNNCNVLVEKRPVTLTEAREDSTRIFQRGVARRIIVRPNPDTTTGHDGLGHRDAPELRLPLDVLARLDVSLNGRSRFGADRMARLVASKHRPVFRAHVGGEDEESEPTPFHSRPFRQLSAKLHVRRFCTGRRSAPE